MILSSTFNKTKVIASIGPSSSEPKIIKEMIEAGVDGFRFNFAHSKPENLKKLIDIIRNESDKSKKIVTILGDIQGPKIRIEKIENGSVLIKENQIIEILDRTVIGNEKRFSTTYKSLSKEVKVGDRILIDDGLIKLIVVKKKNGSLVCEVIEGGELKERKGLNIPDSVLKTRALTKKDFEWIDFSIENQLDFLALSFVRNEKDVIDLKNYLKKKKSEIKVISKIELKEGVKNFESILKVSDGIMVARGDLGVELGPEEVPPVQKAIIKRCIEARKLVITATQLLDSMIYNPIPTRAEASDVANVVLDGTDAVLLTAETTIGKDPVRVVKTLNQLIARSEKINISHNVQYDYIETDEARVQSIAKASCQISNDLNAEAIIPITYSGFTAIVLSKYFPSSPIIALTNNHKTAKILNFYRGVESFVIDDISDMDIVIEKVLAYLKNKKLFKKDIHLVFVGSLKSKEKAISNLIKVLHTT